MQDPNPHRVLHRLAWLTAIATFPLIFMGGLVTSHDVGLAVPDWPNSFGYNMFLLPWGIWFASHGVFLEHTHRLLGTVVGLCAMATAVYAWWPRRSAASLSRTAKSLALVVLLVVIVQGVLGGLRVVWRELDLAVVHGIFAQITLCLMGLAIVATSQWWQAAPSLVRSPRSSRLRTLAILAVTVIFAQLVVGAIMRHYKAGLAIPDLPLAYGHLLPPAADQLDSINTQRLTQDALGPVTLWQIYLHYAHRVGAVLVTTVVLTLGIACVRRKGADKGLRPFAVAMLMLLAAQFTLGVLTVYWRKPADIASAHVATGALLLLTTFMLMVRLMRLYAPRPLTSRVKVAADSLLSPGLVRG